MSFNVEPLPLAEPLAKFVGPLRFVSAQPVFSEVTVICPQRGIGHGEIRVELNSPLEQSFCGMKLTLRYHFCSSEAIRLQGFQGGRGSLLQRCVKLLCSA